MSYLIQNNTVIATTSTTLKSGAEVQVSHVTTTESLDANRSENLVNAFTVKVSNAKKWAGTHCQTDAFPINNSADEFKLI